VVVLRRREALRELASVAEAVGVEELSAMPWDPVAAASACADAEVVVATTPAGATDPIAAALPREVAGTLLDVVYAPWPTRLAAAWADRGGPVVGGLDLLVHQAVLQVVAMTGTPLGQAADLVDPLRSAGLAALATR
jgi:shikimate dehydrogenase